MANYRLCRITMKHGNKRDIPELLLGEPAFCKDTGELYIGNGEGLPPTRVGSISEEQLNDALGISVSSTLIKKENKNNIYQDFIDTLVEEVIKDNFKFGIYEDAECTKLIKEVKSNKEDGTVTFEDLRFGTYYIKESKQPHGYQLSDKVLKLEINDKGVFIDNTEIEEKDDIYSFTFYNDLIPKVQTGNEMSYILLATLMGLSLIGITTGVVVLKRKNRKDR